MKVAFIIYLIGYVLSVIINIKYVRNEGDVTVDDLACILIISTLSWFQVIVIIASKFANINRDTIIFKKRKGK